MIFLFSNHRDASYLQSLLLLFASTFSFVPSFHMLRPFVRLRFPHSFLFLIVTCFALLLGCDCERQLLLRYDKPWMLLDWWIDEGSTRPVRSDSTKVRESSDSTCFYMGAFIKKIQINQPNHYFSPKTTQVISCSIGALSLTNPICQLDQLQGWYNDWIGQSIICSVTKMSIILIIWELI